MAEKFTLYPVFQRISNWGGVSIFAPDVVKWKKILSLLLLTVLTVVHPVAAALWNTKLSNVIISLYILIYVVLAISNLFCNVSINLSQTANLRKFFKCFAVLDFNLKRLSSGGNVLKEDRQFYVYLILCHLALLGIVSVDLTYRTLRYKSVVLLETLVLSSTSHCLTYLLILTILQFACIVSTIKTILELLNGHLHEVFAKSWRTEVMHIHRKERLKCLMRCYDKVFEMTALCNKIFGVPILVLYPYLLAYYVRVVTVTVKLRLIEERDLKTFNMALLLSDIFGCFLCLTMTILITSVCVQTKQKVREASLCIFKIVVNITHEERNRSLEESLVTLSHSLMTRSFSFTAGGFFELDYGLMFALIGSVAYYVVILIQFS